MIASTPNWATPPALQCILITQFLSVLYDLGTIRTEFSTAFQHIPLRVYMFSRYQDTLGYVLQIVGPLLE